MPRCIFPFVFILLHVFWASWICDVLTFIDFGKFAAIIFSNVSSATFFLSSAATSITCWILCHSSSVVCFPHVLVCIISTDLSLRSRRFPPLCHHLMSTSKQFFTSADTWCLVWDLESGVFLSVTEPWHSTLSACWHQRKSLSMLLFPPQKQLAIARLMTQGSCWWQRFSQFCSSLSHRWALCTWASDPCLVMTCDVLGGSFLPSHQEADFCFVAIQDLNNKFPISL